MDRDARDRLIDTIVSQPQRRNELLDSADLTPLERDEISSLCDVADAVWLSSQDGPALLDDPTAVMLGLIPDAECRLDSAALKRARMQSGQSVSEIAFALKVREWEFTRNDVFRWETRSAIDVPPAVIQSLAEIVGQPVEALIIAYPRDPLADQFSDIKRNPVFEQLVARWSKVQRVSQALATAALDTRMRATVHRGERPDADQMLRSLEALVSSLEDASERDI